MQWLINIIADVVMKKFEGMILIYSGPANETPDGWQYCDGTNGTPDLRERFVCCEGGYLPHGIAGGWPVHNHVVACSNEETNLKFGTNIQPGTGLSRTSVAHDHTVSLEDANHLPPFYTLAYIMKVAS